MRYHYTHHSICIIRYLIAIASHIQRIRDARLRISRALRMRALRARARIRTRIYCAPASFAPSLRAIFALRLYHCIAARAARVGPLIRPFATTHLIRRIRRCPPLLYSIFRIAFIIIAHYCQHLPPLNAPAPPPFASPHNSLSHSPPAPRSCHHAVASASPVRRVSIAAITPITRSLHHLPLSGHCD